MNKCKQCGSYAINEHLHGREKGKDLDLCDVCYWRKKYFEVSTDILPLLNPWRDVLKETPATPRKVFVEYNDGFSISHKESWYCEETKSFCGVYNVIRWMEIPKNEVEE